MSLESDRDHAPGGEHAAGAFPCTELQKGMWAEIQAGRPYGFNVAMRWRVDGRLPHAVAEGALQALVRRHEILRTEFREIDGQLNQIVRPEAALKLNDIDLTALGEAEREARAEEIARAEALALMDPGQAPLLRATLLRLAPDRSVLMLTFHSLVADGWSIGLLVAEFEEAAAALAAGRTPDATPPDLQFADYALWERELLAGDALDEARTYWRRKLRGAVGTTVPPDRSATGQPAITSILLPQALTRSVEAFARQHNTTLFGLAVTSLALMLHRTSGEREIVLGSQVANREEPAAETLAGPTMNSITLCLPVDDNEELGTFAAQSAEVVREALQHQRLPFTIAEPFATSGTGKRLHAINLVVHRSYSGTSETEPGGADFTLLSLPSLSSGTQWDLNFFLIGRDEGWRMSCEADTGQYDAATVRGLLEAWRTCVEALATAPDQRIADCASVQTIAPRARTAQSAASPRLAPKRAPIPVHDPARQVVRFHEEGALTPMITMNNRSVYFQLAQQLGADRPFIDIQCYHPDGPVDLAGYTFDDFAAYAVRLIRWAQPRGPYLLGGHCVFGALAFEAARQLQRMGEKVHLVALFDSWAPGYRETMSPEDQAKRRRQIARAVRIGQLRRFLKGEIGLRQIAWNPVLHRLGYETPEGPSEADLFAGRWFDDFIYAAAAHHRPAPADIDAVLFRSAEPLRGRLFDKHMGWRPIVAGSFYYRDVKSGHLDMFRERPAAVIAAALNDLLAEAEGRTSSSPPIGGEVG